MRLRRRPPNQHARNTSPATVTRRALLAIPAVAAVAAAAADDRYANGRRKDPTVDDLSGLFIAHPTTPALPMMYRVGKVKAWDPQTARNTVTVDGNDFTDLPILNGTEAKLLTPGAVVGIVDIGTTWAILGRMTIPGTPDAASALDMITLLTASVDPSETGTGTSFTDLTTVGPAITCDIGPAGRALVTVGCLLTSGSSGSFGLMGYDVSGATTLPPDPTKGFGGGVNASSGVFQGSSTTLVTGLNAGSNTFTARYIPGSPGSFFAHRLMVVQPF